MSRTASRLIKRMKSGIIRLHPLFRELDRKVPAGWVVGRSAVSNQSGYCYFRIPKCANSTIVKTLAYHDPHILFWDDDLLIKKIKKSFSHLLSAGVFTIRGLQKKFHLFTFVRNPYVRLLSAYLDKIAHDGDKDFDPVRNRVRRNSKSGRIDFEGFVAYLENGGLYRDSHWIPQVKMVPIHIQRLHFIGRVENLEPDLRHTIETLFGQGAFRGVCNRTHGKTNSIARRSLFYSEDLASRVYQLYREDFLSFGYQADSFLSD